jgi:hypothetical protein
MLALTHHFLVQVAARRSGWKGWFPHYALLGDDIVIANEAVANCYLVLMGDLGVDISIHKSLESDLGVFEFGKRLVSPTSEFTPLGAANVLLAVRNWCALPMLFVDLFQKGQQYSIHTVKALIDSSCK